MRYYLEMCCTSQTKAGMIKVIEEFLEDIKRMNPDVKGSFIPLNDEDQTELDWGIVDDPENNACVYELMAKHGVESQGL